MLAEAQCWQPTIFGAIFVALGGPRHLLPAFEFQNIFEVILESWTEKGWKSKPSPLLSNEAPNPSMKAPKIAQNILSKCGNHCWRAWAELWRVIFGPAPVCKSRNPNLLWPCRQAAPPTRRSIDQWYEHLGRINLWGCAVSKLSWTPPHRLIKPTESAAVQQAKYRP